MTQVTPIISHNIINSRFLGKIALEQSNIHKELKWDGFVKQTGANRCLSWGMILLRHIRFESCLFPSAEFDCRESSRFNHWSPSLYLLCRSPVQSGNPGHVCVHQTLQGTATVSLLTPHGNVMLIGNQVWLVFLHSARFKVSWENLSC